MVPFFSTDFLKVCIFSVWIDTAHFPKLSLKKGHRNRETDIMWIQTMSQSWKWPPSNHNCQRSPSPTGWAVEAGFLFIGAYKASGLPNKHTTRNNNEQMEKTNKPKNKNRDPMNTAVSAGDCFRAFANWFAHYSLAILSSLVINFYTLK